MAYLVRADPSQREVVERVHGFHMKSCPVARSIGGSIDITTEVRIIPVQEFSA